MASNHKLTAVLQGRIIAEGAQADNKLLLHFTDGSLMTVKTVGKIGNIPSGAAVRAVRQKGVTLNLDLEDGTTVEIQTAEPTSSVLVRAENLFLEYAD